MTDDYTPGARVAGVVIGMLAAGPFALLACEDASTDSGGTPVAPTATTPTGTTTTPNPPTPTGDAASNLDSGEGGVVEPIPNARTLKLVNLSNEPAINACLRKAGTADAFAGPLFRVGGIPKDAVSARVLLQLPGNGGGNGEVKMIAEGAGCESAGLASITLTLATQADNVHLGVSYHPGSGSTTDVFVEHLTPTPGKESVLVQPPLRDVTFTRDDGVGAPINLRGATFVPVAVAPNLVGKITLPNVVGLERPMKTETSGTISLWSTPTSIILCDERAPAVNGLTHCPTTLRAP